MWSARVSLPHSILGILPTTVRVSEQISVILHITTVWVSEQSILRVPVPLIANCVCTRFEITAVFFVKDMAFIDPVGESCCSAEYTWMYTRIVFADSLCTPTGPFDFYRA